MPYGQIMSSDAERLASWVREMPLASQVAVTGATLILADVKANNPGAFDDLDEALLREASTPEEARDYARQLSAQWIGSDHPEAHRVVGLCDMIVEKINDRFA